MKTVSTLKEVDVLAAKPAAMLKFSASWCGPCRAIAPAIDRLAAQHSHVTMAEVDIDQSPEIASRYSISAVPTFVFMSNGKIVATVRGADVGGVTAALSSLPTSSPRTYGPGYTVDGPRHGTTGRSKGLLFQLFIYIAIYFLTLFSFNATESAQKWMGKLKHKHD